LGLCKQSARRCQAKSANFRNRPRHTGSSPPHESLRPRSKPSRKWLRRYHKQRLAGLNGPPRIALRCPYKTPADIERKIVQLRKQSPFMGAKRLRREHNLPCSHEAIRRILNQHGLLRKRRKKHKHKRDLSNIKRRWRLLGQMTIDTNGLKDRLPLTSPWLGPDRITRDELTMRGCHVPCYPLFTAVRVLAITGCRCRAYRSCLLHDAAQKHRAKHSWCVYVGQLL